MTSCISLTLGTKRKTYSTIKPITDLSTYGKIRVNKDCFTVDELPLYRPTTNC
ncbi:hypothetical protein LINPERHAP2_LOCUS39445, partial [Linum perenne]